MENETNKTKDPSSGVFVNGVDKNGMIKLRLDFGSHEVLVYVDKDYIKSGLEYIATLPEGAKSGGPQTKCGFGYQREIPGGAPRLAPSTRPASQAPQKKYAAKSSSAPRTSKPVSTDW